MSSSMIVCTVLYTRYEGEWEKGLKQGKGVFTYPNGDVFTVRGIIKGTQLIWTKKLG